MKLQVNMETKEKTPEGVNYRRNVTDVKKYRSETDCSSEDSSTVNVGTEPIKENCAGDIVLTRPVRDRKPPAYLKDYEVYTCGT